MNKLKRFAFPQGRGHIGELEAFRAISRSSGLRIILTSMAEKNIKNPLGL